LVSLKGIPYVVPVILLLLVIGTFVLGRTAFGRHIYAVGGNAEAARRAGINVKRIRIAAFMICSSLAAIAGMIFASTSKLCLPYNWWKLNTSLRSRCSGYRWNLTLWRKRERCAMQSWVDL
jgi:ribose/xylose/arabinose/galactoside ABC-type transport system permease subunit